MRSITKPGTRCKTPLGVARSALIEVGRIDLAAKVYTNRAGMASMNPNDRSEVDDETVVRAFHIAHTLIHPHAVLERVDGELGIWCDICWNASCASAAMREALGS